MWQMMFVPTRVRVNPQYLLGEESQGLKLFRGLVPPFIHIEVVQPGTPEHDDLAVHPATFDAGENFATNVIQFLSRLIDDRMGQGTKEFSISTVTDSVTPDAAGKKLGIPLIKAIIAEMISAETTNVEDADYMGGVTKAYVIHPPLLRDELNRHLSALPVPATSTADSERLISVPVGEETRCVVVEPYTMDLTRRRSTDPRWLIVHMYNPEIPAMAIKVGAEGPMTFREPTPLLSDTEVAEKWAMKVLQGYLRSTEVDVRCVRHEPNGPTTFPDYQAQLNAVPWDFEVTRILGDILRTRHILDNPRDRTKVMNRAVQSPPLEEKDAGIALDKAIKSKENSRARQGATTKYCLILLNPLDLDIDIQSDVWKDKDLTPFDAVVLINGFSHPRVGLIKGPF